MDGSYKELFRNYVKKQVFEMDMHLKNYSLIKKPDAGWTLCPAYDMVPSALVMKDDPEELALNINGKKRKIKINIPTDALSEASEQYQQNRVIFEL